MKTLKITGLEVIDNQSRISWEQHDDSDTLLESGSWAEDRVITKDELLEYAKSKVAMPDDGSFAITLSLS